MFSFLKKNQGYSLVEVMVGMVGLSIVVLLLATVVQTSIKTSSATREGDYALAAARAKLNELTSQSNLKADIIPSDTYGEDNEDNVYKTPNGTPLKRYWKIGIYESFPPTSPVLVEVWVLKDTTNKDTTNNIAVKISGFIDPNNTCKPENVTKQPTVTYKEDGVTKPYTAPYNVEIDFKGASSISTNDPNSPLDINVKSLQDISVAPHIDDAKAAEKLIIGGRDKDKVKQKNPGSVSGGIEINTAELPTINSNGSNLEFTLAYASCDEIEKNPLTVRINFVQGLGDVKFDGADADGNFFGEIEENCTGCNNSSAEENRVNNKDTLSPRLYIKQDGTTITVENAESNDFPFKITNANGGGEIIVSSKSSIFFDYENRNGNGYKTEYTATRGGKTPKKGSITIKVKDVNEPPTGIIMNSYYQSDGLYTTSEDFEQGLEVATITVKDNDTASAFLNYNITLTYNSSDIFEICCIDKNTAKVKIKSGANLETTTPPTNYNFNVEITVNTDANSPLAGGTNSLSTATNGFIDANGNTVSSSNISRGISLKVDDSKCAQNPHLCVGYKDPCLDIPEWKSGTTTGLVKYDKVVYYPDFFFVFDGAIAPHNNTSWLKIIECEKLNDKNGTKDFNNSSGHNQNTDRVLHNNYIYLRVGAWTSSAPTGTTIATIDNGWLCLAKLK
jgi:type II secretory pathway pseudopilin PulG